MAATNPIKTADHLRHALHPSPRVLKQAMSEVDGFNAKFALFVTRLVGTMWCAYLFCVLALMSLPAILSETGWVPTADVPKFLRSPGLILIVAWIAQTFIQLVLLSVIMVGQNVQSLASDARSENTYKDTELVLDRLDTDTAGGLQVLLARIDELERRLTTTQ